MFEIKLKARVAGEKVFFQKCRIFKNLIILTSTLLKYNIPQVLFGVNIDYYGAS